jgi:hypothetical protein
MSVYAGPEMLTNGLILCLDAGNTKSYPGSGTSCTELARNSTGTIYNTPTFSSSDAGGSFTFVAASSQYIDINIDLDNTLSAGITMQAWVKITSYSLFNRILTIRDAAGTGYQYWIQTAPTSGIIQFGTAPGAYTNGFSAVGTGTWVNLAGTCNYGSSSIKLYINGVDDTGVNTGTPAYTADVGSVYIARLNTTYSNFALSNVQLYNRALTAAEIRQNFNAMRGRFGL